MLNLAIFYLCGAVIVGGLVAVSFDFSATWKGRQLKHSKLIGSVLAGIAWP